MFIGGIPMLFYGDEVGYTNDYSYMDDPAKSYDNRWMHRPVICWDKNNKMEEAGSIEEKIFTGTQQLICLRKKLRAISDHKNITWLATYNKHIAGYLRTLYDEKIYCLFNFSNQPAGLSWEAFKQHGLVPNQLLDCWQNSYFTVGSNDNHLVLEPYSFYILKAM